MAKYDVNVQLSGTDGNAFAIIGTVARALRRAGMRQEASEFEEAAMKQDSYDGILRLAIETVNVS